MKLCRFVSPQGEVCPGLTLDGMTVLDLRGYGLPDMAAVLEHEDPLRHLEHLTENTGHAYRLSDVRLLAPTDHQEVWAAGVTYLRSRKARTKESDYDASAYDRVYEAERPELFFKCSPGKVVSPGEPIGIRTDSRWTVPEPELALVFTSNGKLAGCTIGNDVSARDIEGANLLYLPQAKVYDRSCALGPWILVGRSEAQIRRGQVAMKITRAGATVFEADSPLANLRRTFDELRDFLWRSQSFPQGVVLLTGTGIVPPDGFALAAGDVVRIEISGIGLLENPVLGV